METNLKFNSAICTSRSQSERLLALGLKPETADMCYKVTTHDFKGNEINEKDRHYTLCCWYDESSLVCGLERKETIPAWSLHRLIEMMPPDRKYEWLTISKNDVFYRCIRFGEEEFIGPDCCGDNLYDSFVIMYEWLIKKGYFPKEYLV